MNGICGFADDEYGTCQGPMLQLNDNAGRTHYCEYHARMVDAWATDQKAVRPFHKFWDSLSAKKREVFQARMAAATLESYVPYVPLRGDL